MMITSTRNDKIRLVRSLQARRRARRKEGRFVIEGMRLCREAIRAGAVPDFVLTTPAAQEDERVVALLADWTAVGVPHYQVADDVMEACSDTETPQGVLAVVPIPHPPLPRQATLTLILDRLRDPGNLGTILRTALGAGVDQVLLPPGTVDPLNPKVVRAGAGAQFRLPIAPRGWDEIAPAVSGCQVYVAAADGRRSYTEVDWRGPVALIVGGEAFGAGERAYGLSDETVFIPMASGVESLNAAVATAVLLFEAVRQRRSA
jgi:TrmH family RNA methyltransferase